MDRLIRIALIIAIPLMVALATFVFLKGAFYGAANPSDSAIRLVEIEENNGFGEICAKLHEASVIKHCWAFGLLARMRKVDTQIKAGEYEVSPAMTPREVLEKLTKGDMLKRILTVKEGDSIWQVGEAVATAGLMSKEEFNKSLVDQNLLALAGVSAPSFEGYLFPETYNYSRPIKAQQIIWRMLEEGEKRWTEEFQKRADDMHLTRHEILTLASIIEKESGNLEEQPVISSVFHNRLEQGMRLQSDPTVIYGIPNFNGNLTRDDLQSPSPYNTYMNFGLPPGPIANPGAQAIRAALFPAQTSFLFFVADGTGSHAFATTLQEHNENVKKFQKDPAAKRREGATVVEEQPAAASDQ